VSAHTPGPWNCGPSKYNAERLNVQAGMPSMRVLASFDGDGEGYDETDEANANLIAAAPDYYEATEVLLGVAERGVINDMEGFGRAINMLRAAHAKATQP